MNILYKQNGMVAWPDGWDGQNYNATNEPCDMLVGPCSCGAWHNADESWVRRDLEAHNDIILERPTMPLFCPKCKTPLDPTTIVNESLSCGMCFWLGKPSECLKELPSTIRMPYVSIDLETTGIDHNACQILEIGAVFDDGTKYADELPVFHKYVYQPDGLYTGEPFALQMNAKILKRLSSVSAADIQSKVCVRPDEVAECFRLWLFNMCKWDCKSPLTPAGKNFASFDKNFLDRLPGWKETVKLNHRALDPAVFYWRPAGDERLPGTQECMDRAGLKGVVAHTAVEDAEVVVRLIRKGVRMRAGK
jgi:hypothetical protein